MLLIPYALFQSLDQNIISIFNIPYLEIEKKDSSLSFPPTFTHYSIPCKFDPVTTINMDFLLNNIKSLR